MKQITVQTFKEKLNLYYSDNNGEKTTESVVEDFSAFVISQNKDNNPFFYDILLSTITHRNIPLNELTSHNNTVIRQIVVEAKQTATEYQQRFRADVDVPKADEINQNSVVKSNLDRIEQKQKVDDYIEKYGGFEEFLYKATKEEIEEYIDVRKYEKVLDDADAVLIKWINNPEIELTEEEKNIIKNSKVAKKFGYDEKTGTFENLQEAKIYAIQLEAMRKSIQENLKVNGGKISKEQLDILYKSGQYDLVLDIKSEEEISRMVEQLLKDYIVAKEVMSEEQSNDINATILSNNTVSTKGDTDAISMEDFGNLISGIQIGETPKIYVGEALMQQKIDRYLAEEFQKITDPALAMAHIELKENVLGIQDEQLETNFTESLAEVTTKKEIQEEQTEEIAYETPTIEVEKKGLAKWFDKLKQSRNPFAKLLTGSIWKKQNNLLNAAGPQKYEDKPSTGRFDSTDTQLMPVGKGARNSVIQAMDKISNLFRGKKKEKQPTKVMEPATPKNAFDARYAVDADSLGSNNVIIPTAVNPKVTAVDRESEAQVIDDYFIK